MVHIPYGYKIVNGKAAINEEQAVVVRKFFEGYISGQSLKAASINAGLDICHGSAGRMLRNKHYLGDDYYPAIIEQELFDKAEEVRMARAGSLGRIRELKQEQKPMAEKCFSLKSAPKRFSDPFKQAEYAYSLIESKVTKVE